MDTNTLIIIGIGVVVLLIIVVAVTRSGGRGRGRGGGRFRDDRDRGGRGDRDRPDDRHDGPGRGEQSEHGAAEGPLMAQQRRQREGERDEPAGVETPSGPSRK